MAIPIITPTREASRRLEVRALYQKVIRGEWEGLEEAALAVLEEPELEEELTPLESLERSLTATIHAGVCRSMWEWALSQMEKGLDKDAILQTLVGRTSLSID
jgi:hypothetical protein